MVQSLPAEPELCPQGGREAHGLTFRSQARGLQRGSHFIWEHVNLTKTLIPLKSVAFSVLPCCVLYKLCLGLTLKNALTGKYKAIVLLMCSCVRTKSIIAALYIPALPDVQQKHGEERVRLGAVDAPALCVVNTH